LLDPKVPPEQLEPEDLKEPQDLKVVMEFQDLRDP